VQHGAVLFKETAVLPPTAYTLTWNYSSGLLKIAYRECLLDRNEVTNFLTSVHRSCTFFEKWN